MRLTATLGKAYVFHVALRDSTTEAPFKSGASPTVTICKPDSVDLEAIAGSVAEVATTGVYRVSLAAGDMDVEGDNLVKDRKSVV